MLEREIKRLAPKAGPISAGLLAVAVGNTNSRVRKCGLSAKEILTKREHFSGKSLRFNDKDISSSRYDDRIQNHESSAKSKALGAPPAQKAQVSVGDIVHVKSEGSKHKARDYYLITSIDNENSMAQIQKFVGSTLREKPYHIKLTEIYPAATNYVSSNNQAVEEHVDEGEGIELYAPAAAEQDQQGSIRRSECQRRQPQWLATKEIQRNEP